MPTKPNASPSKRQRFGASRSQIQATSAPNSGELAFSIDVSPVLMCCSA
jgi:hypothetical protein